MNPMKKCFPGWHPIHFASYVLLHSGQCGKGGSTMHLLRTILGTHTCLVGVKWWNLPNLIKEEIPIWRGKGDEKRKKPMSYQQTKTQKCKPINEICKRQQLGLAKEVQNNNLKPKTLTNCVKHIWQRDVQNTWKRTQPKRDLPAKLVK